MPYVTLASITMGALLWLVSTLFNAAQPHYYTFKGWWPNGLVAHAPYYHDCQENGWNTTADYRCAFGDIKPHLAKSICDGKVAYSNALPGLGFKGNAICIPE